MKLFGRNVFFLGICIGVTLLLGCQASHPVSQSTSEIRHPQSESDSAVKTASLSKPLSPHMPPSYVRVADSRANVLSRHLSTKLQGLSSWNDLRGSLEDNLGYILKRPQDHICVERPGLRLTWGQLADSIAELIVLLPRLDKDPTLIARRFQWLKVAPKTLLTGYYEPWLEASMEQRGEYQYPLYKLPKDLKTTPLKPFHYRWKGQSLVYRMGKNGIEPYPDRAAIDAEGVLAGRELELAWVKDPIDIFFLQIQGSGRLVFDDGSVKHVLYSGKNGRKYVSLGKLLIENGDVPKDEMSMQRIRRFLNMNPEKAQSLMFKNPSYVFFRLSDIGPFGSLNAQLTPRVSVAVDRSMIPLGSVLALKTTFPKAQTDDRTSFMSLVLAQDTGGAIKGTRMDLFCGSGEDAEFLAGHLQADSEVFMLLSKRILRKLHSQKK